jgi:hypothetical protein
MGRKIEKKDIRKKVNDLTEGIEKGVKKIVKDVKDKV